MIDEEKMAKSLGAGAPNLAPEPDCLKPLQLET
jgi:hypothetical protein